MGVFKKMSRPDWMTDAEWEYEEWHRRFYRNRMIHGVVNIIISSTAIVIAVIAMLLK